MLTNCEGKLDIRSTDVRKNKTENGRILLTKIPQSYNHKENPMKSNCQAENWQLKGRRKKQSLYGEKCQIDIKGK